MLELVMSVLGDGVSFKTSSLDSLISSLTKTSPAIVAKISDSPGGDIVAFSSAVHELDKVAKHVIFDGRCASACTMFLKLSKKACATDKSVFVFHSVRAQWSDGKVTRFPKKEEDAGNAFLQSHYPDKVKLRIMIDGGLPFDGLIYMKGTDILRKCD